MSGQPLPTEATLKIETLCEVLGVELVEEFSAGRGSEFVAHVRDAHGRELVLKCAEEGDREALYPEKLTAYRLWYPTEAISRLVDRVGPNLYTVEYLRGFTLEMRPDHGLSIAKQVGDLARRLHVPAPAGMDGWGELVGRRFTRCIDDAPTLDVRYRKLAIWARERIEPHTGDAVVIHGDFAARNVVQTADGLKAIDPRPRAGYGAIDLARYLLYTPSEDYREDLKRLVCGYGEVPPLLAECVIFLLMTVLGAHANGILEGSPAAALVRYAEEIAAASDPAAAV